MLPGRGHEKGAEFERVVGRQLSFWLTHDKRADLFTRNVLSGGSFTRRVASDDKAAGIPGDIMAKHPLAYNFLQTFLIECKHYADLGVLPFLLDLEGTSFLAKTLHHAQIQAAQANVHFLVIAKQNRIVPLVIMSYRLGELAWAAAYPKGKFIAHRLHNRYFMTTLPCLMSYIQARAFVSEAAGMLTVKRRPLSVEQ